MAAFWWSLIALAVPLVISPSSSTQLNPETSAYPISTFLANSPPIPPFQELSPDIAPLLPSPGGALPSPATSSIPTIPSSPSPPNPDEAVASGPDSAFSPLGALLASSAAPRNLINLVVAVVGLVAYRSIQLFQIKKHNASSYYSSDDLLISASLEKLVPLQSGQVTGVAMNVACQERFLRSWSGNWIPAGTWF
ncbi:hydroxyproline-rich glycoprotein [Salix suchowensis]|nr:hydroxyproline-rich glycoprotein [Salix suchowensis]